MSLVLDLFEQKPVAAADEQAEPDSLQWQSRYAEFVVCAYLTKMGHHVIHVDTTGFDLVLDYEGQSYRVDVKSTRYHYAGPRREMCEWTVQKSNGREMRQTGKKRLLTPSDTDLLALFHLAFETVTFVPVLAPMKRVRLPAQQIRSAGNGEQSLAAAINQLRGRGVLQSSA